MQVSNDCKVSGELPHRKTRDYPRDPQEELIAARVQRPGAWRIWLFTAVWYTRHRFRSEADRGRLERESFDFTSGKPHYFHLHRHCRDSGDNGTILLSWMRRKQMGWWVALMLPGFLLRSLVPVGFMPMVGSDHSVKLVVCDSYAPVPWASASMDMDMSQPHHAEGSGGGGPPVRQDHGTCSYGSSPALGALPTLAILPEVVPASSELAVDSSQIAYFEVSPRAQSPRGPPA